MKILKLIILLSLVSNNSIAQCYSKIVSYSRNYIALQTDGTLWSKGTSFDRRLLGFGNVPPPTEFTQIGTDNNWTENISITSVNVFAIKTDGTLWVWGRILTSGSAGLGTFDELDYITPTQVGTDTNWAKVATGSAFTIGVKTDGTLWAWGSNDGGRLGIANTDDLYKTNVPIQVGSETNWKNVYTGLTGLAYAIKTDDTLWSWGNDGIYLGYPNATTNNNYRSPKQVGTDTWKTIAVGLNGPMIDGIKTDGTLWGWGKGNAGLYRYGNGTTSDFISQFPIQIGTDADWREIGLTQLTTFGLKTDGTRWGWGLNSNLQDLGIGTGVMGGFIAIPTQLENDTDWKTISVDLNLSQGDGIKENNTLYHWGANHLGTILPVPILFSSTNCTLGVDSFPHNQFLVVYPNPFNENLLLRLHEAIGKNIELTITNSMGQQLFSEKVVVQNNEFSLNLSNYAQGVYYIILENQEYNFKSKIIKN